MDRLKQEPAWLTGSRRHHAGQRGKSAGGANCPQEAHQASRASDEGPADASGPLRIGAIQRGRARPRDGAGGLAVLESGLEHDVEALEESAFLFTPWCNRPRGPAATLTGCWRGLRHHHSSWDQNAPGSDPRDGEELHQLWRASLRRDCPKQADVDYPPLLAGQGGVLETSSELVIYKVIASRAVDNGLASMLLFGKGEVRHEKSSDGLVFLNFLGRDQPWRNR